MLGSRTGGEFESINADESTKMLRVLLADYDISCDSRRYNGLYMAYALLMVVIYPIGIPWRGGVREPGVDADRR